MDLTKRITEIQQKSQSLNEKKIRLQERLRSEKKKLTDLVKQIKEKGYDPKDLKKIKEQKEQELDKSLKTIEETLIKAEEILSEIESADEGTN